MLVRRFWRDCDYRGKEWGCAPQDAFCVEATQQEGENCIYPWLQPPEIAESEALASDFGRLFKRWAEDQGAELAAQLGDPKRPFCFLVARDLSSIDPFTPSYPVHHMWNAYSPFESMPEEEVATLNALRSFALPPVRID